MRAKDKNVVGEKTVGEDALGFKKWASIMGKMGGSKGGFACAKKLSKRQRRQRALKAIHTRWENVKKKRQNTP